MSAYIVSNKTINGIIGYLCKDKTQAEKEAFGQELLDMNKSAIAARYGADEVESFVDPDQPYKFGSNMLQLNGAYRALSEYLYQCAEGDIPKTSLLYRRIQKAYDQLAHELVRIHQS